jgi:hypothetical protein
MIGMRLVNNVELCMDAQYIHKDNQHSQPIMKEVRVPMKSKSRTRTLANGDCIMKNSGTNKLSRPGYINTDMAEIPKNFTDRGFYQM